MSHELSDTRYLRSVRRLRPLLIGSVLALATLCVAVTLLAKILISSFEQVEDAEMRQEGAQVFRALETDLRQLHISNRDYAEWDDAVAYLQTRNPAFIAANYTRETLTGMRVDVVWMADRDGNEVYSCYLDRTRNQVVSPAPRKYIEPLRRFAALRTTEQAASPVDLIVSTPDLPAAVAAREIKRTDATGATGAVLVFARFIADADLRRVANTSQLPLDISYLDSPKALARLPATVRAWVTTPNALERTLVWAPNHAWISAYLLIRNVDRAPVAIVATRSNRATYALGYRTTADLLGVILVLAAGSAAIVVWFVARLRRSFAARHATEMRFRIIGEQLEQAIVLLDATSHRIIDANQTVLSALRCPQEGLRDHNVNEVFPDIDPSILQLRSTTERKIFESRACRRDGGWTEAEVALTVAEIGKRRVIALVGHDISHRKEAERRERDNRRQLLRVAQQDALTTLPNRAFLSHRLPQVLRKISGTGRLLALMYLDIDHFKNINDSRGHPLGDQVLQIVARRLRATVAAQDVVARMGGDEFVVVATLLPDIRAIEQLALRLRTAIAAPVVLGDQSLSLTASLGVVVYPDDGGDAETLLKRADIALYHAKSAGRNCHRFFSSEMDQKISERAALEQLLHQSLGTDQIFVEYQPIVELSTGRIASLEALMRWRHPQEGLISPARFIPIAEQAGLIVPLGEHVLKSVIGQLREWLDADVPVVPIAVNVSPLQLEQTDFAATVVSLTRAAGVDPRWLRFEITESAMMNETGPLVHALKALRKLGSRILIDDFGTGYSSLSYLNRLPVDVLKIDKGFVRDLGQDVAKLPIVNAVIDMAKQLRLTTIAEGIEAPEQAVLLLQLGCDFGQGFLYSKPVSATACGTLLNELKREAPLTQTVLVRALSQSKAS
jgi:diguanylate cyclase (GGDEF)-like protein/PAS domain S-box-containing protein